jgi:hypothetical protein
MWARAAEGLMHLGLVRRLVAGVFRDLGAVALNGAEWPVHVD